MSWEDCGFKPGTIDGPATCPRRCGECDGQHHFYAHSTEWDGEGAPPAGWEPTMHFACKHCDAVAEMEPEDDEPDDSDLIDYDEPQSDDRHIAVIRRALSLCEACKGLPEMSINRCPVCRCLQEAL